MTCCCWNHIFIQSFCLQRQNDKGRPHPSSCGRCEVTLQQAVHRYLCLSLWEFNFQPSTSALPEENDELDAENLWKSWNVRLADPDKPDTKMSDRRVDSWARDKLMDPITQVKLGESTLACPLPSVSMEIQVLNCCWCMSRKAWNTSNMLKQKQLGGRKVCVSYIILSGTIGRKQHFYLVNNYDFICFLDESQCQWIHWGPKTAELLLEIWRISLDLGCTGWEMNSQQG